ncbi:MAG: flagellar export chaperone FlgN [Thermoleophilia bacterium]|nr:flagellar export chaperone FlgN [Thermoleophilia bacterium]
MRDSVIALAECLDLAIEVQERMLGCLQTQRRAIIAADHAEIEAAATEMEGELLRLGGIESNRTRLAAELADELGVVAARWSAIREGLETYEREYLGERVARVEELVRDLELHNTINGQLIGNELELVDVSIRTLASGDAQASTRAYTSRGDASAPAPANPVLLNLAA